MSMAESYFQVADEEVRITGYEMGHVEIHTFVEDLPTVDINVGLWLGRPINCIRFDHHV